MSMQGADIEELRALARKMSTSGTQLATITQSITSQLMGSPWNGNDSNRFKDAWNGRYKQLMTQTRQALETAAQELDKNAQEQQQASDGATGAGGAAAPAGGAAGGVAGSAGGGIFANTKGEAGITGPGASGSAEGFTIRKDPLTGDLTYRLGKVKGEAHLVEAKASGQTDAGPAHLSGDVSARVGVKGEAEGGLKNGDLYGKASAGAGLLGEANGKAEAGPLLATGTASALLGAKAKGEFSAGEHGVTAKGEAMVGAEAEVKGSVDVGGIGLYGHASAIAGVGVKGEATFGMQDDRKFHMGLGGGAADMLGASGGFEITVDPAKVAHTAEDLGSHFVDWLSGH